MTYSELLRRIPLSNKAGVTYPDQLPSLVVVPELRVPPIAPVQEMFQAWLDEVDQALKEVSQRQNRGELWNQWYRETYLSKKPMGIQSTLLPSKR
ncbi:similar to Saccharomyces cerevisiae YGR206W MVB12 ESCRT-I subunit required to stabilize oligomers of the ESCRT-I core complex (Stp22p, Vps28p, Srn2p) [Maudiozyma barnettii]|uniref:Similar to Saccharomyces cerevisiae YGR206W MVB12 ESCRT-I subunit required to stabilize oligomers of the ESCRT-I core complex (Stp22p, Vps28p, Srn2p) n=1 Tax=Maudiozyma barnettii TaxID=61262 RepID=A0A8H2VJD2_9SACH|nr:ubiquitin-binding ESCRT-I subunit protein MVB12 [Kazachstania barnettii]CAB4256456.1 similar to Saccharomyces cerevisiae YGR206W MVB12 ESCRT-I subunit required to stabilize oligomers of the ESCRT-I core complex (Stp22p, Vps28p, Srn2p) [Kazachstania barnettii]CAD1785065.1 similar to Saccharomyces cerevisiae YGR206W MVB12 ESCRT-I subunit required to stabilize oligomers of the ESCRT-I core complex (Stp22p, Vps28p, Srn2p) [Kazachstania barnettii]